MNRRTNGGAMIVALSALAVSIAVPVSSPAAWGAQGRQASRQEQDPETRIARPERPEVGSSQVGETIQTPNYAPTDFAGAMFAPANAPSAQGLATPLAAVAEAFATGGSATAASYASRHGIAWRGGSVLVRVDAGQPVPELRDVHVAAWVQRCGVHVSALRPRHHRRALRAGRRAGQAARALIRLGSIDGHDPPRPGRTS